MSERPYIGGQAVIEGVMMRSPHSVSVVCRRRSGELVVREEPAARARAKLFKMPLVRGVATLVESLQVGTRALRFSAELYEQDLGDNNEGPTAKKGGGSIATAMALTIAALATQSDAPPAKPTNDKGGSGILSALPILFALALFVALPQATAEGISRWFHLGLEVTSPAFQAITGGAKLVIIVSYLLGIRLLVAEVRRVFQYHGAEHKAISTYEASEALSVENARRKTTLHARCGTTFLVMVALVSIIVFSIVGAFLPPFHAPRLVQNVAFFAFKLPFLPVIAAITFELQRFFARYCSSGPLRVVLWPGFLVQKITTAEPNDDQLEVALASLKATLWREANTTAPKRADRTFPDFKTLVGDPGYLDAASS